MPLPKFKFKRWCSDLSGFAMVYVILNLILAIIEVLTYWLEIPGFRNTITYVLVYLGKSYNRSHVGKFKLFFIAAFVLPPLGLAVFLLLGVRKKDLQKVWIWWLAEIVLLALLITVFMTGLYKITWTRILFLLINTVIRILGLKIIFDFMITLNSESNISKIEPSDRGNPFEIVSLDNAEKF